MPNQVKNRSVPPPPGGSKKNIFDKLFGVKYVDRTAPPQQPPAQYQQQQQQQLPQQQQQQPQQQQRNVPFGDQMPPQGQSLPYNSTVQQPFPQQGYGQGMGGPPSPSFGYNNQAQGQQQWQNQGAPMRTNSAASQMERFRAEDQSINAAMSESMRPVMCQMLDGSTQQHPATVAKQLLDFGLVARIMDNQAPPMQQQQQPQMPPQMNQNYGYAPNNNNMMQQQQGGGPDDSELVELELPNGQIKMVPRWQAERMGCIPVDDPPMPMNNQMPPMLPNNSAMMGGAMGGFGDLGGGVPIGPPRLADGSLLPPEMAMQVTQSLMPMQRSIVVQKPMAVPMMQRSITIVPQEYDPMVQVILPDGQQKMMPKSQALQLQSQLQGGGMMASPPQQYMQQQYMPPQNFADPVTQIPWGQDIGDM